MLMLMPTSQTKSFAAVMFRRIATKTRKDPVSAQSRETFLTLQEPQQLAIREKLLHALGGDLPLAVRNKLADAVAEIARQYTDNGRHFVSEEPRVYRKRHLTASAM
jgi:hypothetical protein